MIKEDPSRLGMAYITAVNVFLIFLVVTAFVPSDLGVGCSEKVVTWQWLVITLMDTL